MEKLNADVLAVRALSHSFTSQSNAGLALADIDLTVRPGEVMCLLGSSGCGKSTLLNNLGGLLRPTSGDASCGGKPIFGPRPDDVAFVFQEIVLFPWSTVIKTMETALEFRRVPRAERRERAMRYHAEVSDVVDARKSYARRRASSKSSFWFDD